MNPGGSDPVPTVPAEDGVLLREGLVGILERFGFAVVASVGDGEALVEAVAEHGPRLVVTDIRMPPTSPTRGCAPPCGCAVTTRDWRWWRSASTSS